MNECDYCQHVEMCGWRKSLEERGCDFFDDGNRWIPVSERLPEESENVLFCSKQGEIAIGYREAGFKGLWFYIDRDDWHHTDFDVISWQPLPVPYQEGGN